MHNFFKGAKQNFNTNIGVNAKVESWRMKKATASLRSREHTQLSDINSNALKVQTFAEDGLDKWFSLTIGGCTRSCCADPFRCL